MENDMIRKVVGYTIAMSMFLTLSLGVVLSVFYLLCSVTILSPPFELGLFQYVCAVTVLSMCVFYRPSFARLVMRFEAFAENRTLAEHEEACGLYDGSNYSKA
jgi:hypothetical protein